MARDFVWPILFFCGAPYCADSFEGQASRSRPPKIGMAHGVGDWHYLDIKHENIVMLFVQTLRRMVEGEFSMSRT